MFVGIILLIISTTVFCDTTERGRTSRSRARVPKHLKVTPNLETENVWSSTLESNIYQGTTYLNPEIDYSGFNGWDFSIASYNIPVQGGGGQPFELDTYFGISKTFKLTDNTILLFGTQNGTTLLSTSVRKWHNIDFANIRQELIEDRLNVYIGPYYANANLTGSVNQVGFMTGFEVKIIPKLIAITGDYYSGHQNISGAVVNIQYNILNNFQTYIGIIVPEKNSGNEFAGIFGFNLSTKGL